MVQGLEEAQQKSPNLSKSLGEGLQGLDATRSADGVRDKLRQSLGIKETVDQSRQKERQRNEMVDKGQLRPDQWLPSEEEQKKQRAAKQAKYGYMHDASEHEQAERGYQFD